jgi:23S rRNA (adenine2030-N6)-methyltransferase
MNYRHAYHAGNFADVLKHAVLARLLDYLKRKDKAFRVIDTHAGIGRYDLSSPEAQKTGEWRGGIGRLIGAKLDEQVAALLAPYLDTVRALNRGNTLETYPGSPLIARRLLRRQDRLSVFEKHPQDAATLRELFAGDIQCRATELDGWLVMGAHVPPKEKRGLVLVDPPFEEGGEYDRMVAALQKAHRRWPGGIYALWYPVKERKAVAAFRQRLASADIADIFDIRLEIRAQSPEPRLDGCGMVIVNPPYLLETECHAMLPVLAGLLAEDGVPRWSIDRLSAEGA